jgi:hypothetical protein
MANANERQVGGSHYKKETGVWHTCENCKRQAFIPLQHWDIAWIFGFDCFQYIITKWVFRWRDKGGREDLKKAIHGLEKYLEVTQDSHEDLGGPTSGYVNQGD